MELSNIYKNKTVPLAFSTNVYIDYLQKIDIKRMGSTRYNFALIKLM